MEPRLEDPIYVGQRTVLTRLFTYLLDGAPDSLQPEFQADFRDAQDHDQRIRVVIDQLASLTDSSAVIEYRRLSADGEQG
jgi:dGTPase